MGLFTKFFFGLKKTQSKLSTEIRRIVSRSPKLTGDDIEELEAALLASDMGLAVTQRIINVVRETYESGGGHDGSVLEVAQAEVVSCLGESTGRLAKCDGLTVVSLVGVNGTGKTTTAAKLAHRVKADGGRPGGVSMIRFSTNPLSVTSTTRARRGLRLTNSTWRRGLSAFGAITRPAHCDRPERAAVASSNSSSRLKTT